MCLQFGPICCKLEEGTLKIGDGISPGSQSDTFHRRFLLESPVSVGLSGTKSSKVNMTINAQLMSISMAVMRESFNNSIGNLSIELSSKVMYSRDVCLSYCHKGLSAEINESVALSSNMKQVSRGDFEVIIIFPFYVWLD
jgi:hypothetical protein